MKEPHVTTFMDRVRRAIRAFKGKPLGSLTFGVEVKQCKDCEFKHFFENEDPTKSVLYRCDGKACGAWCPNLNCDLTHDVKHARNFEYEPRCRKFVEKQDDETLDEEVEE